MKLDVYEKFIVLHTHTGKQRDYISTREREKETEKERGEHTQTQFCEPSATEKINKFIFFLEQKYEGKTREKEKERK